MKLPKDLLRKTLFLDVNPAAIAGFRRRALATRNEILAQILGEVYEKDGAAHVRVEGLYYPELAVSTPDEVTPVEIHPAMIGSIHSHPEVGWIGQSDADVHSAIMAGERVYGIYSYFTPKEGRRRTRLNWYAPGRVVVEV